jgi:hypothetical protein
MLRPGSKIISTGVRKPKRGPKKRKSQPAAITAPAVVKARKPKQLHVERLQEAMAARPDPAIPEPPANDDRKSSIVTVRRRGRRFADVPDMTPEEHQRRGDLADALWRDMVRRITDKGQQ